MPCWANTTQSYLRFCPILRTDASSSNGLQNAQGLTDGTCFSVAFAEIEGTAGRPMSDRHVAGLTRCHRHREANEFGLHRIEARRFNIEGEPAGCARLGDPPFEVGEIGHGFVSAALDFAACGLAGDRDLSAWRPGAGGHWPAGELAAFVRNRLGGAALARGRRALRRRRGGRTEALGNALGQRCEFHFPQESQASAGRRHRGPQAARARPRAATSSFSFTRS